MTHILAINGSYRDDGIIDQAVEGLAEQIRLKDADVTHIRLRDWPIDHCLNCRECMQSAGKTPGRCVLDDGMQALIDLIEQADGYILAAPTNVGSVTAVFKRFMERLAPYAYWPWGAPGPTFRLAAHMHKKAVVVNSCAAPGLMGRWLFSSVRQLKKTARVMGAKPVACLMIGQAAKDPAQRLSEPTTASAGKLVRKLLS